MPWSHSSLTDPFSGRSVAVAEERTIGVVNHGHPPVGETVFALPWRERFFNPVDDSTDMVVDGSTTNVDFIVQAVGEYDIYVQSVSALIGDGGSPALNKFGALPELANGIEMCYVTQSTGEFVIHDGIKTNLEWIRMTAQTTPANGNSTDSFLLDVSGGGTEKSYIPTLDFTDTFGLPFGLKLRKGTTDFLTFKVRDDLSALSTFNIIGYGLQI
jgi:hypothetical protein